MLPLPRKEVNSAHQLKIPIKSKKKNEKVAQRKEFLELEDV